MRRLDPERACWVDGRRATLAEARVSIDDPGLQMGLGLFETLALRQGRVLELEDHLRRLAKGATTLGLSLPGPEQLRSAIAGAASEGPAFGWVKLVCTGGGHWFVFSGSIDPEEEGRPVSAVLLPWRRSVRDPLVGLKTLNYAGSWLGTEMARSRGADEGLWLNSRGHLAEGCTSNLFVVTGRTLYTPGRGDGILPGVVRQRVLEVVRGWGLPVHEGRLRLRRLERASEAFLTSSVRGIRPLIRFRGREVGSGRPGAVTLRIAAEVTRRRALEGGLDSCDPAPEV